MINNYNLISPVLIIVSIGLVAYLVYLMSLMLLGSTFRVVENVLLVLVIVAAVVILAFIIREQTKIHEKLNRVLARASGKEEAVPELPVEKKKKLKKEPGLMEKRVTDDQKKRLKYLFEKDARPSVSPKERERLSKKLFKKSRKD